SDSQQLRALDAERVDVRRQSRKPGLLHDLVKVVIEEQADGCNAHRRAVAKRAAGEMAGGNLPPVTFLGYCLDNQTSATAVASLWMIIGRERPAQRFLDDTSVVDQRLRHPQHHFGIVGVAEKLPRRNFE